MNHDSQERHSTLKGELSCSICTQTFEDPHALDCGHSYCGGCILEWLKASKICPICRASVTRRPIHIIVLQKLADTIRTETVVADRKLKANDWIGLFPQENQTGILLDEDEDGTIHRCSRCGWELDEDNFCPRCAIQYDGSYDPEGNMPMTPNFHFANTVDEPIEVSDSDNSAAQDRDLSDFVVSDNESIHEAEDSDEDYSERRQSGRLISISSNEDDEEGYNDDADVDNSDIEEEYRQQFQGYDSSPLQYDSSSNLHSDAEDEHVYDFSGHFQGEEAEDEEHSSSHFYAEEVGIVFESSYHYHYFHDDYQSENDDVHTTEADHTFYHSSSPYSHYDSNNYYNDAANENIPYDDNSSYNSGSGSNIIDLEDSDHDNSSDGYTNGSQHNSSRRLRKRIIVSDDEGDEEETDGHEVDDEDGFVTDGVYADEEEEEEERPKKRSVYVDDIASEEEDDEIEDSKRTIPTKVYPFEESIKRAKAKMLERNHNSSSAPSSSSQALPGAISVSSSDEDSDDDSDVADYANLLADSESKPQASVQSNPTVKSATASASHSKSTSQPFAALSASMNEKGKENSDRTSQSNELHVSAVSSESKKKENKEKNKNKKEDMNRHEKSTPNTEHNGSDTSNKKRKRKSKSNKKNRKKHKAA